MNPDLDVKTMNKLKTLVKIVFVISAFHQGIAEASFFSGLKNLAKQTEDFFSLGKIPTPLPPNNLFPSIKHPRNYNAELEPVVRGYYAALEMGRIGIGHHLFIDEGIIRILREGFSVWLPKGKNITDRQIAYLTHRIAYLPELDRYFSTIFQQEYTDYVKALKKSADYLIPARFFESKILKPVEALANPRLDTTCKRDEIKRMLKIYEEKLRTEFYNSKSYLPLLEEALQKELDEAIKYSASAVRREFMVDEIWSIYGDLQDPFGPIKLTSGDSSVSIEFPAVCGASIQFTFYYAFGSGLDYKIKFIVDEENRAIIVPHLNKMLLKK